VGEAMKFLDKLLLRDARTITEVIPPETPCVDVTITSPPYWNLKNYEVETQIGHGQSKAAYLEDVEKVLKNCLLVTKPTGSLWVVIDDYRDNGAMQLLHWEVAACAQRAGWSLRDIIIWDKQHTLPWHAKGQMRNVFEYVLFMTKTSDFKYEIDRIKNLNEISQWWVDFPERFNPKGKTPTNIWRIPVRTQGAWRRLSKIDHHCPFPTELVARIIELTTDEGDLVMDPFAGSGVVLAQAAAMGRHFTGFEINKTYAEMYRNEVRKEVASEWRKFKVLREKQSEVREDFEQTIMKLRALKFARQVTKPFIAANGSYKRGKLLAVLCVASIPNKHERKQPFDLKVYVVIDGNKSELQDTLKVAKDRSSKAPLTLYELSAHIEIITYKELKSLNSIWRCKMYLYPDYKPRKFVASGRMSSMIQPNKEQSTMPNLKIPMFANIAVDVAWVLED
jgi:DNA modification methylase